MDPAIYVSTPPASYHSSIYRISIYTYIYTYSTLLHGLCFQNVLVLPEKKGRRLTAGPFSGLTVGESVSSQCRERYPDGNSVACFPWPLEVTVCGVVEGRRLLVSVF